MALIKCPDCGKDVSDKAKVCINCGFFSGGESGTGLLVFSGCSTFGNRCRFFIALRLDGRKTFHRKVFSSPFRILTLFCKF